MAKTNYIACNECDNNAEFRCTICNKPICGRHTRFRTVCTSCIVSRSCKYIIRQAYCEDIEALKDLVILFWGDLEQQMFGKNYIVTDTPALVVVENKEILGFIFYTLFDEKTVLIVALGVRPEYQGCGIGQALIKAVEEFAEKEKRSQLIVVTSNDNLPALAFYQHQGYQLFEVAPNVIAKKLGGIVLGNSNIPIRDELRLRKTIN